jgi:hypothetical protein
MAISVSFAVMWQVFRDPQSPPSENAYPVSRHMPSIAVYMQQSCAGRGGGGLGLSHWPPLFDIFFSLPMRISHSLFLDIAIFPSDRTYSYENYREIDSVLDQA